MLTKAELYMIRGRANLTGRTRALRDHTIEVLRADSRALLADLDTMDEALRGVLAAFAGALRFAARVPEMSRLTREEVDTLRRAAEALGGE